MPVYQIGSVETPAEYTPAPGDFTTSPEETKRFVDAIEADPEYDPSWAKPWLRPDFVTPDDPTERERLWGPREGDTWLTSDGWSWEKRAYGAVICENLADGSLRVEIETDKVPWVELPNGEKPFRIGPGLTECTPQLDGAKGRDDNDPSVDYVCRLNPDGVWEWDWADDPMQP